MNHMKYMQKIVLLSAFFCITNQEILAASGPVGPVVGPTGPNVFGKNLVAISAMTPAQQAAAYPKFLQAATAAVQSHNPDALSDNFAYMQSCNYNQAQIDIFNNPSFSYANLTKNGFTQPELEGIGDRLVLAPSKALAYSTGTLVSPVAPAPTLTSYEQSMATLETAYATDPTLLNDLPQILQATQAELSGLTGADLVAKQQEIEAIQDFIQANTPNTSPPISNSGSGKSILDDDQIQSIKQGQFEADKKITDLASYTASLQSQVDEARTLYLNALADYADDKISETDLDSMAANWETKVARGEQYTEDTGQKINISEAVPV